MKKVIGVAAVIGLGLSLTWAAAEVAGWLGFRQPDPAGEEEQIGEGVEAGAETEASGNQDASPPAIPELSAEAVSIDEDLARIEEALQSEEVLEEFTPSEPLSADNPIPMPTDI